MNLSAPDASRFTTHVSHGTRCRRRQSGSAVIVVIALLAIILVYVAGNLRTLYLLGREVKLVEREQIHRLQSTAPKTNAPPTSAVGTNSIPSTRPN